MALMSSPEFRTLTSAVICYLLIFNTQEIRIVETETTSPRCSRTRSRWKRCQFSVTINRPTAQRNGEQGPGRTDEITKRIQPVCVIKVRKIWP